MERIAAELSGEYDDEYIGMSFRGAYDDVDELVKVTKGAQVYTHSAGMLAMRHREVKPKELHAFAPPLRATSAALVARAALCGYDATKDAMGSLEMIKKAARCGRELAGEVVWHAAANLGRIATIAAFDAIETGIAAKEKGVRVGLGFMKSDRLFIPNEEDKAKAKRAGIPLVLLTGGHVDFSLRPVETVMEYEEELENYRLAA